MFIHTHVFSVRESIPKIILIKYNISDNYHTDIHDYLPLAAPDIAPDSSPPSTPPPVAMHTMSMELDDSYNDDFFTG
jgi:hypothetical protein